MEDTLMKLLSLAMISSVLLASAPTLADSPTPAKPTDTKTTETKTTTHQHHAEAKAMTVKGEVVDMGCYMAHAGKGPDHKSCAMKCIQGGMPMGVLTADGKLYLLTMSHDNADPFNQAKGMAAETVEVTGPVHERSGMKSIEVTAVKTAAAPARARSK